LGDYFKNITDKFILRSGLSIEKDTAHKWSYFEFQSYANIGYSYLKGYLFLIVLILTALAIVLANSRLKTKVFSSNERIIIFLLTFPVLLHHLILFDFTAAHDSSVLITAPFLAFLAGLLFCKISPLLKRNLLYIGLTALLLFTFISSSLNQYTYEAGHKVKLYDLYKNLGQNIKDSAPSDRIIFYCNNELTNRGIPPLSYFTQRSVVPCENKEQAVAQLKKIQTHTKTVQKGIIYYYTNDYLVEKTEEVQSQ
jgi:hypothetical protein